MGGLSEIVAVACNPPAAVGGSASPEATVTLHDIHTLTTAHVFKKSATPQNALAVSRTHVFAAQADKSVLNVYNRVKGGLEAIVPLPEVLSAVACSQDGGVVVMGTTTGRVTAWETSSGRYSSTALCHLQRISVICIDRTASFVLTASDDTTILVWSLPHLLTPANNQKSKPLRSLEYHRQPIVALACGKGRGPAAIAVSAARDRSCIVWNYQDGTMLRSVSVSGTPLSLALDPADRAFYVGLGDGGIQQVEFARVANRSVHIGTAGVGMVATSSDADRSYDSPLFRADERHVPIAAAGAGNKWSAEGQNSPITTIDVVFEGNYLVTGTESGAVNLWDVATGHLFRTLSTYKAAPISCVRMLPPIGFPVDTSSHTALHTVVLPRYHDTVKAASGGTIQVDTNHPPLTLQFRATIPTSSSSISAVGFPLDSASSANVDPFSAAADMAAIERGIAYFNSQSGLDSQTVAFTPTDMETDADAEMNAATSPDPSHTAEPAGGSGTTTGGMDILTAPRITLHAVSDDADRVAELEKELAAMKERYKRLSELHKQTWEEHAKWVMDVDKERAGGMSAEKDKAESSNSMDSPQPQQQDNNQMADEPAKRDADADEMQTGE
ncbi:Pre-rRNA-processing protein ipi3 [Orbilia brochopaga]|uniref:Pre-rRNA-processing protein IPI3 n=1 Tax=Orbilia brochopaga TaxID=3140254 RepID=A0AAV9V254_9PEZI